MENYEAIREAIARFLGYEYGIAIAKRGTSAITVEGWFHPDKAWDDADYQSDAYLVSATVYLPDPLNNPSDAWALQCAIAQNVGDGLPVRLYFVDERQYWLCKFSGKSGRGETPEEALVRAWQAAFGGEA